jgi:2-polyprenyl-3-methyl-5-hydroxy-6-metoxy-1,4-benzoquinol methylase
MIERANVGLHDYLFEHLKIKDLNSPTSILDLAAGSGAWLNRFTKVQDDNKLGLDLNIDQFAVKNIKVRAFNFDEYYNEKFGQFELITCIELIEHLENPGKLIELIKNNLSPSGICLISTPNIHSIHARVRYLLKGRLGHFDNKSDPTHIYPVYFENLNRVLQKHALMIVQTFTYPVIANFSLPIRIISRILRMFIPNIYAGDNIIFVIKHQQ